MLEKMTKKIMLNKTYQNKKLEKVENSDLKKKMKKQRTRKR